MDKPHKECGIVGCKPLILLVCFRTTMGLCGFNSVAPLDLVTIEFRVKMPLQNCVQ